MHKNKNRFLTFIFALIPGCGHMYLGYMKRGLQFMAMFAIDLYLSIMFAGFFGIVMEFLSIPFLILLPVIWLYQMFDAMHSVSHMRGLGIAYPVDDGFFIPGFTNSLNPSAFNAFKKRGAVKAIAVILICVGVYVLYSNILNGVFRILDNHQYWLVFNTIRNYTPPIVISLALIFAGIKLLAGKKGGDENNNNNDEDNNRNGGDE
ncbi:MAG: hypothetical protein FWH10_05340 [Oscillospiraceae bacterium]|nr:hypothetical protein [Oscillospiraceae bacterium]